MGPFDMLVNNAGIAILEPFFDTKLENFQKSMKINVEVNAFQI